MYILAKHARTYTKVLLTGEGADEVFYGYRRYTDVIRGNRSLLFSNAFCKERQVKPLLKHPQFTLSERKNILKGVKNLPLKNRVSAYDFGTYLPHVLLRQDKAGMAANVENRVPYLYGPVVQYGLNLKNSIGELDGKTALKKVALKYFPKELVLRKKCGFGLPIAEWLRDGKALKPHLLRVIPHPFIRKYFHAKKIIKLILEHLSRQSDHSGILFGLLALTVWHDVFISSSSKYASAIPFLQKNRLGGTLCAGYSLKDESRHTKS